jgi:RNA polymerase sigma-70 factor (ECF subfamily)
MTTPPGTSYGSIGSTSSSLIELAKARDPEAWRRLVRLYGPLVDFWIRRVGLQVADAEDVFQDVFQAVARGITAFRKDRPEDTFRGWLRTITRSKVGDFFRRRGGNPQAVGGTDALQRWQELAEADSLSSDGDEAAAVRELWLRGLALIRAEFEDRTWQMFWRVTVDDQATADAAAEFGVTPAAVRLAKSRILRRLREELGEGDA